MLCIPSAATLSENTRSKIHGGIIPESELMENDKASSYQERKCFSVSCAGGSHVSHSLFSAYETNGCYLYLRRSPELVVSARDGLGATSRLPFCLE